MTCIIGFKEKNKVTIAGDTMVTYGDLKSKTIKIFKKDESILAAAGFLRNCNIVKTLSLDFEMKNLTEEILITKYIPTLQKALEENERTKQDDDENIVWYNQLLIANKNKLWQIDSDFSLTEIIDDYTIIGSGTPVASGILQYALSENKTNIAINKILYDVLLNTSYVCNSVDGPFNYMDTKNLKLKDLKF